MTDAEFEKLKEAMLAGLRESHDLSTEEYEQRDWDRTRPSDDKIKPINTPVFKKHVINDDGTADYELADDVARPKFSKKDTQPKRSFDGLLAMEMNLRAFCPTGPGGGIDNSCGSEGGGGGEPGPGQERQGDFIVDHRGLIDRIVTNNKPLETYGPGQDKDLDTYRNDKLKKLKLAESPVGKVVEDEDGNVSIEFASAAAQKSYEETDAKFGITVQSVMKNYERLLVDSDPRDADWYHARFNEMKAYAEKIGVPQTLIAAVVAVTSPQQTWSDPQVGDIEVSKGWKKVGDGPQGVTKEPNMNVAKGVIEFMRRDTPMMYKGRMVRPSEKDSKGNFVIPAEDLFNHKGYKGGHPDAPGALTDNLIKAAQMLRGEKSIDDGLGTGGSSMKVRSFFSNLIRPWGSQNTTIDGLMCQAAGAKRIPVDKNGKPQPHIVGSTPYRYSMLAGVVNHLAQKYGMKPHEVQARIWVQYRKENPNVTKARRTRTQNVTLKARAARAKKRKGE